LHYKEKKISKNCQKLADKKITGLGRKLLPKAGLSHILLRDRGQKKLSLQDFLLLFVSRDKIYCDA